MLLQHRVLSITPHHGRSMVYSINATTVFNRILFPHYIMMAREAVGEVGELIVEDLLQHGQSTMAQVAISCMSSNRYNGNFYRVS